MPATRQPGERSSFDLRRIMDEGKILVVNLAKGKLGEGPAALLGSLLVSHLPLVAMERADRPQEERRDFCLYLDQFHTFATLTLATMLSELRNASTLFWCINISRSLKWRCGMQSFDLLTNSCYKVEMRIKNFWKWSGIIAAVLGLIGLACLDSRLFAQTSEQQSVPLVDPSPNGVNNVRATSFLGTVKWPARTSLDKAARTQLEPDVLSRIDSSSLPVLLPKNIVLLKEVSIHIANASYSASLVDSHLGVSVSYYGNKHFTQPSSPLPIDGLPDSVRGVPAAVYQSEGIWSLTWEEFGVAYLVMLDCNRSVTNVCDNDAYLRSLAEDLAFVGGSFESQAK